MPTIEMTTFSTIPKGWFDVEAIRKEMVKELVIQGRIIKKSYEKTTANWKGQRPIFTETVEATPNELKVTVGTDDRIFGFIERGTAKRYAFLSSNWVSQTTPKVLSSRPGQGRVLFRGKTAYDARGLRASPGLQPRKYTEEIIEERKDRFPKEMENRFISAVYKYAGE